MAGVFSDDNIIGSTRQSETGFLGGDYGYLLISREILPSRLNVAIG